MSRANRPDVKAPASPPSEGKVSPQELAARVDASVTGGKRGSDDLAELSEPEGSFNVKKPEK